MVKNCNNYLKEYQKLNFSLITYYEIVSGLKHKDANKKLLIIMSKQLTFEYDKEGDIVYESYSSSPLSTLSQSISSITSSIESEQVAKTNHFPSRVVILQL